MQPPFCAGGFLYNLKNHKILLIQTEQTWSIMEGESNEGEDAQTAFARIVNGLLNLNLKEKNIHPVYDYLLDEEGKIRYVFYADVKSSPKFDSFEKSSYSWVSFAETPKLPFAPAAKQDIIVGERVINARWREADSFGACVKIVR